MGWHLRNQEWSPGCIRGIRGVSQKARWSPIEAQRSCSGSGWIRQRCRCNMQRKMPTGVEEGEWYVLSSDRLHQSSPGTRHCTGSAGRFSHRGGDWSVSARLSETTASRSMGSASCLWDQENDPCLEIESCDAVGASLWTSHHYPIYPMEFSSKKWLGG